MFSMLVSSTFIKKRQGIMFSLQQVQKMYVSGGGKRRIEL